MADTAPSSREGPEDSPRFRKAEAIVDFPKAEEAVRAFWKENLIFEKSVEMRRGARSFVWNDGPPTANGRPGIHHVISRTLKDVICRFRAMSGRHVTRIAGWDTHGLPVEIEAEKKLGISGKRQIEEIGVARFNQVCRESVFTYKEDWERLSERIAYWLDYSRAYVTFTPDDSQILVACGRSNEVVVIDAKTMEPVKRIEDKKLPWGVVTYPKAYGSLDVPQ